MDSLFVFKVLFFIMGMTIGFFSSIIKGINVYMRIALIAVFLAISCASYIFEKNEN